MAMQIHTVSVWVSPFLVCLVLLPARGSLIILAILQPFLPRYERLENFSTAFFIPSMFLQWDLAYVMREESIGRFGKFYKLFADT
jgi:hypothetical protein